MNSGEILELFNNISVWKSGNERSPNKSLLILLALGKWFNGSHDGFSFSEFEKDLTPLLKEFGPYRATYHPEYPFFHLTRDKIWDLTTNPILNVGPKKSATKKQLQDANAKGNFSKEIIEYFNKNPEFITEIASLILENTFPENLHSDILASVGLPIVKPLQFKQKRDPSFRQKILTFYNYKCAVCSLNIKILSNSIALDAAHIRWHNQGGPDTVSNGLALCVLHHKIFDLGAFTISPEFKIIVSDQANGTHLFDKVLSNYHGEEICLPREKTNYPAKDFLIWHNKQIFKDDLK